MIYLPLVLTPFRSLTACGDKVFDKRKEKQAYMFE